MFFYIYRKAADNGRHLNCWERSNHNRCTPSGRRKPFKLILFPDSKQNFGLICISQNFAWLAKKKKEEANLRIASKTFFWVFFSSQEPVCECYLGLEPTVAWLTFCLRSFIHVVSENWIPLCAVLPLSIKSVNHWTPQPARLQAGTCSTTLLTAIIQHEANALTHISFFSPCPL